MKIPIFKNLYTRILGLLIFFFIINPISIAADSIVSEEPTQVGVLLPLSGEAAAFGKELRAGIDMASGAGVHLLFQDDACHPQKALTAFQAIRRQGVVYYTERS